MLIYVLLYQAGGDGEGIHSIDVKGKTIVIMFEDKDDAERYKGLLEAQDFPVPSIELIDKHEIELFCENAGYVSRLVEKGFVPETEEERLLLSPPQKNLEGFDFGDKYQTADSKSQTDDSNNLESIRQQLEKLL